MQIRGNGVRADIPGYSLKKDITLTLRSIRSLSISLLWMQSGRACTGARLMSCRLAARHGRASGWLGRGLPSLLRRWCGRGGTEVTEFGLRPPGDVSSWRSLDDSMKLPGSL